MKRFIEKLRYIFLILYTYILVYKTIINRPHYNPFAKVWEGWWIFYEVKRQKWNLVAIYNIFLLTPLLFFLVMCFKKIYSENTRIYILRLCAIGFCSSLFIEVSQIIFECGTFQVADLVYNTLSAVIGGMIYKFMYKRKK